MDANVTVSPSLLDARRMETVLVLTRLVLSGATSPCLVQPALTPEAVAFTARGSREESGHMKPVPPQPYRSITTITNTTTVFNVMGKIAISVRHTSITVDLDSTTTVALDSTTVALDSTMAALDSTTVVLDTTTVVLGEDAAIVDQVDPDITVVVDALEGDATTMGDLDSIMVAPGEDATTTMVALDLIMVAPVGDATTMVALDSMVVVAMGVL